MECQRIDGEWVACPLFFGSDLKEWIVAIENFFHQFQIPEVQYVYLASQHFQVYSTTVTKYEEGTNFWCWSQFTDALMAEFNPMSKGLLSYSATSTMETMGETFRSGLHDGLDEIEQTSSVEAYFNHFEAIKSLVSDFHPWLPEAYFADRFIYGLRKDIQPYIIRFHPRTVLDVFHLACIYEYPVSAQQYDSKDVIDAHNFIDADVSEDDVYAVVKLDDSISSVLPENSVCEEIQGVGLVNYGSVFTDEESKVVSQVSECVFSSIQDFESLSQITSWDSNLAFDSISLGIWTTILAPKLDFVPKQSELVASSALNVTQCTSMDKRNELRDSDCQTYTDTVVLHVKQDGAVVKEQMTHGQDADFAFHPTWIFEDSMIPRHTELDVFTLIIGKELKAAVKVIAQLRGLDLVVATMLVQFANFSWEPGPSLLAFEMDTIRFVNNAVKSAIMGESPYYGATAFDFVVDTGKIIGFTVLIVWLCFDPGILTFFYAFQECFVAVQLKVVLAVVATDVFLTVELSTSLNLTVSTAILVNYQSRSLPLIRMLLQVEEITGVLLQVYAINPDYILKARSTLHKWGKLLSIFHVCLDIHWKQLKVATEFAELQKALQTIEDIYTTSCIMVQNLPLLSALLSEMVTEDVISCLISCFDSRITYKNAGCIVQSLTLLVGVNRDRLASSPYDFLKLVLWLLNKGSPAVGVYGQSDSQLHKCADYSQYKWAVDTSSGTSQTSETWNLDHIMEISSTAEWIISQIMGYFGVVWSRFVHKSKLQATEVLYTFSSHCDLTNLLGWCTITYFSDTEGHHGGFTVAIQAWKFGQIHIVDFLAFPGRPLISQVLLRSHNLPISWYGSQQVYDHSRFLRYCVLEVRCSWSTAVTYVSNDHLNMFLEGHTEPIRVLRGAIHASNKVSKLCSEIVYPTILRSLADLEGDSGYTIPVFAIVTKLQSMMVLMTMLGRLSALKVKEEEVPTIGERCIWHIAWSQNSVSFATREFTRIMLDNVSLDHTHYVGSIHLSTCEILKAFVAQRLPRHHILFGQSTIPYFTSLFAAPMVWKIAWWSLPATFSLFFIHTGIPYTFIPYMFFQWNWGKLYRDCRSLSDLTDGVHGIQRTAVSDHTDRLSLQTLYLISHSLECSWGLAFSVGPLLFLYRVVLTYDCTGTSVISVFMAASVYDGFVLPSLEGALTEEAGTNVFEPGIIYMSLVHEGLSKVSKLELQVAICGSDNEGVIAQS